MRKTLIALFLMILIGCATVGVPGYQTEQQRAIEGATGAMFVVYLDVKDDNSLSDKTKAEKLIKTGDDYLALLHPDLGVTYLQLLESAIAGLSKNKFSPDVGMIYFFTKQLLDDGVE